jgi:hypothetical protein
MAVGIRLLANANQNVDEATNASLDGSEPFVVNIKRQRAEVLSVKANPAENCHASIHTRPDATRELPGEVHV